MKRQTIFTFILLLVFSLLLSACSTSPDTPVEPEVTVSDPNNLTYEAKFEQSYEDLPIFNDSGNAVSYSEDYQNSKASSKKTFEFLGEKYTMTYAYSRDMKYFNCHVDVYRMGEYEPYFLMYKQGTDELIRFFCLVKILQ